MAILGAFVVPHPPIILPEIGRGEERRIQATIDAYREAMKRAAALSPDTVVVTSPHAAMYADYFHVSPGEGASGDFGAFRAPEVKVTAVYDDELARAIGEACREAGIDGGTGAPREPELDHGTMVPLRFLQECMPAVKVVRIGLSGMSPLVHYRFGAAIARAAQALGRRVVHIASGDLSHKLRADGPYGFAAEGEVFDRECMAALGDGDFLRLLSIDPALSEGAAECGLRSFWIMAGVLDGLSVTAEALSYEGPFGVGYGVAAFAVTGVDASRRIGDQFAAAEAARQEARRAAEDDYVKLARYSLETFVKTRQRAALPEGLLPELTARRAGVFVSLKKDGQLRGCIGTFQPTTDHVAAEILQNAVSAGAEDPRFSPVTTEELADLVYSIDVLTPPESVEDEAALDAAKYGVIVEGMGGRRGLLLPALPGVNSVTEQVAIARQKGGIGPKEPVKLYRFEVVRHH
ncbi:MAG: AmmeMemoRadiSam system protein A [Schwartzia sp. (in: firmicutes)]